MRDAVAEEGYVLLGQYGAPSTSRTWGSYWFIGVELWPFDRFLDLYGLDVWSDVWSDVWCRLGAVRC